MLCCGFVVFGLVLAVVVYVCVVGIWCFPSKLANDDDIGGPVSARVEDHHSHTHPFKLPPTS